MTKRRSKRQPRRQQASSQKSLYIVGAVITLIAVGAVIGIAVTTSGGDSVPDTIVVPTARPANITQDGRLLGDPGSEVAIVEYLDFQCPFCKSAATDMMPTIEESFVATGTASLEIRPIAILGDESVQAAAAAECANEQGQFWAYHDILYANQGSERSGAFSDERLKVFGSELGLDANSFNTCVDSGRYTQKVVDDTTSATASGVGATPTVLVNGERVDVSIEAISAAIQKATGS